MISIIIPAHNEETHITNTLNSIIDGKKNDDFEIIVICNGCTDSTAEKAKNISGPITVIETVKPSKTNALNIGDQHAHYYPRFYLDADLCITGNDIRRVVSELEKKNVLSAAPKFRFELEGANRVVRSYYGVWQKMPYFDTGRIAGAFALSEEGRKRFDVFPDVISDDGFVRLHFAPQERITVKDTYVSVKAPKNARNLINIKTRSHAGIIELKREYPHLFQNETASPGMSLTRIFSSRIPVFDALIYVGISVAAKARGFFRSRTGTQKWERDESSR